METQAIKWEEDLLTEDKPAVAEAVRNHRK
jgi:hypothetical protein